MTRSPVEVKDSTMIGGILQILNIHYGSPIDEYLLLWCMIVSRFVSSFISGAPNDNFRENICSEDDLRTRIFGTFVLKFIACLPLLGFSNIYKMV